MKKTFKTTIVREGSMCFVPVPFDPRPVFGKVRAPVKVTLNGYTYRSTIASMGDGPCIPLRRSNREAAGLSGGESLSVTLELDTEKREVEPPADLVRALKEQPFAWERWCVLSYSHQREHVEAIEEAKAPETRARRIEKAVRMLASQNPRPATSRTKASAPSRPRRPAQEGHAAMTRYALLLRGVNVGTKNSLPMAELRAMLEAIGCTDVQTYVQSGNAVFGTTLGAAKLTTAIEEALGQYMGRPIATTLRTHAEMTAIVNANPFAEVATDPARLCVTFLSSAPAKSEVAPLHAQDFKPELFRVAGKEIYTWRPNGQGRSPLAEALGKLRLRGAVTTRNWNTVLKVLEMLTDS